MDENRSKAKLLAVQRGTLQCPDCGETLVRKTDEEESHLEVASGNQHDCWSQLPPDAEHLRIND